MVEADRALADRQCAPVQRLGVGVAALALVEIGHVVERARHVGVMLA
jgi:hypothetical protein